MKNIFSQFGSKKVAGAVLAGATLMVGLGVVSNFSGGSQKAANEAALSRFGDSTYNSFYNGSSSSRADLERQMSATQGGYSARFLTGKSDGTEPSDAFSSDGAYTEGVRSGSIGYGAENGEYQPFGSTYEQSAGGADFDANGGNSAYGQAQFQSVQDAAAAAANQGARGVKGKGGKGAKGQPSSNAGQIRPVTQINKMTSSNGGSNFGGGTGSGSRGGGLTSFTTGGSGSNGGGDNNTRALPQINGQAGIGDSQAFRSGRLGNMGGFTGGFRGGSESKGGHSRGTGAASDLQMAAAYSGKALATRQEAGSKSLAEAAFDGSNPEDLTPTIPEGASIDKVASSLMDGSSLGDLPDKLKEDMNELKEIIKETAQKAEELAKLQKKLNWLMVGTALGALALSILIAVLKGNPLLAGIITGIAAIALALMGVWMFNVIKDMQDPLFKDVNQGINWNGKIGSVISILTLSAGLVAAGWTNMWQNAWKTIQAFFKGGAGAGTNGGFSFKAGKEAAKAASEAAEGFKLKDFFNIKKIIDNFFPKEGK